MDERAAMDSLGHCSNMLGLSSALLGSAEFNAHPVSLHIHGTRESNTGLFRMLDRSRNLEEAAETFQDYMSLIFGFEEEQYRGEDAEGRRRFRSSYLSLLQDWGFDSNNPQAAVLKGWVESRFGLFPSFHKAPLVGFATRAWMEYLQEKMGSRYHNNCIHLQLDLLYEFCQWAIERFSLPARRHITLFRGVNRIDKSALRDGRQETVLRLNNLVSFTDRRETAGEFGTYILEAQVPVVKLLFFNDLLARHPLRGEAEYLAIGGHYRVRISS